MVVLQTEASVCWSLLRTMNVFTGAMTIAMEMFTTHAKLAVVVSYD